MSHVTGEMAPCWKARKVTVSARTRNPRAVPSGTSAETSPMARSAAVVPIWPTSAWVGAPPCRAYQMPTKVAATEMTPFAMLAVSAAWVPKPATTRICVP